MHSSLPGWPRGCWRVSDAAASSWDQAGLPQAIAITPDGKTAYVASLGADAVTPILHRGQHARRPIKVGVNPHTIAITP
jgi:DNA-binding beta-propeller fold protein YncE